MWDRPQPADSRGQDQAKANQTSQTDTEYDMENIGLEFCCRGEEQVQRTSTGR